MRKRITAFILAVLVLASLLPVSAAAVNESYEAEVRSAVTKMVKDYAQKVNQSDAADDAFVDFFLHAFFGAGKTKTLSENSAMAASLMNSCLMQDALINGITAAIIRAQSLQRDKLYVSGSVNWYNYGYSYSATGYLAKGSNENNYSSSVGVLTSSKNLYGSSGYTGPRNENDSMQELISGGLWTFYDLEKVHTQGNRVQYVVKFGVWDEFDFDTSYERMEEQGYDTSKDEQLKDIGFLMTYMGVDEFNWEFKTQMQLEVPNGCDHTSYAYRWVYDGDTVTVNSQTTDGFTYNAAKKMLNAKGKDGALDTYRHQLETPVVLKHDRPWVMEWDQTTLRNHQFSPGETSSNVLPTINSNSQSYVWLLFNKTVTLEDGTSKSLTHYLGVQTSKLFKYNSTHTYTHTLENVVNEDGSNMFYLSIYDHDLGEMVVGHEPMDELSYKLPSEKARSVKDANSKLCNGMDLIINYLGNKSCSLSNPKTVIEIRVWENGKNPVPDVGVHKDPTCTEVGGNVHKCSDCGGEYLTEVIPALGHSYGEYVADNNAGCTSDGTQTRKCIRCGEKDTAPIPDTALGHSYGEYIFDNNASCTADGTQTRSCSRCGAKDSIAAPDTATGHSYEAVVTAPTCSAQGYTTYTCHCGDTYKADYTDAKGHTPVIDPAVSASCVNNGLTEGSHCDICGYVIKAQTVVIGGTHLKDEGTVIKEATYDTPGTAMYQCIYCGEKSYVVLPKLDKPAENPFDDVKESDWFYKPVMWAVNAKVTGGKTATTFAPAEGCTRAQVVTFLWAANGKPMPKQTAHPFTDINDTDWYYNAVLWAVENGITGGVSENMFGPEQTCTRAQIATFLWAAEGKHAVSDLGGFSDVAAVDWFATPVVWAKERGITDGIGDGRFGPNDTCTRAQVVTFLNKVYQ